MAQMYIRAPSDLYENDALCYTFNRSRVLFICGMEDGFRIYSTDCLRERYRCSLDGGVLHVEFLLHDKYVVFVGDSTNYKYPRNTIVIMDYKENTQICTRRFESNIKGIKVKKDRLVVILETEIKVYDCSFVANPTLIQRFYNSNAKGICALCIHSDYTLLAFPIAKTGIVEINDLLVRGKYSQIIAHESSISCMAINNDGTRLATSSMKGTLIRIFNPFTGEKVNELRRGTSMAYIYSLNFSEDSSMLCVSSDHGTIHLFYVEAEDNDKNTQTSLSYAAYLSNYFNSMWSFCKLEIPGDTPSICTFRRNKIIAILQDGRYYKFSFTPSGVSKMIISSNFLTLPENQKKKADGNEEQERIASSSPIVSDVEKEVKKLEKRERQSSECSCLSVGIIEEKTLEEFEGGTIESACVSIEIKENKNEEKIEERTTESPSLSEQEKE